jgi:enoyl-CoA hydratase
MMIDNRIRLERKNKIALVVMNRPEKKNAFDTAMFEALEKVTLELERDLPRAVVLTGADDRAFCAGFDITLENPMTEEFLDAVNKKDTTLAGKIIKRMRHAVDEFVNLPVPIIAAVNGPAYGGGMELATRCDLRVMDMGAILCFSEVRLGLMPDWGGGACLARLLGHTHAADLILTARVVKADEAYRMGLINRVSDNGRCLDDAMELAEQISQNGPKAIRHALAVLRQSRDLSLRQALDKEAELAAELIASGECIHGITAFMEKKPAQFPD